MNQILTCRTAHATKFCVGCCENHTLVNTSYYSNPTKNWTTVVPSAKRHSNGVLLVGDGILAGTHVQKNFIGHAEHLMYPYLDIKKRISIPKQNICKIVNVRQHV